MTTATYAPAVPTNPQLSPYGLFGDLARTVAPVAGQALGSVFGNQHLGGQIGNVLGSVAGLLPFGVQPGVSPFAAQYPHQYHPQHPAALAQQQLAPYGLFGDILRTVAPAGGQILGSVLGDAQTGGQVGSIIGQHGSLLPFAAQPGMLHPQQLQQAQQVAQAQQLQQVAQAQQLQQVAQAQQLQQIAQAQQLQQIAQQAVAQQAVAQQAVAQQAMARQLQQNPIQQAQLAPYGIVGDLVRAVAPIATQQLIPNPQVAHEVNQILGGVANLLPFSAQPQQQLNPYGFLGGALGNIVGGFGGSAIGGLFGNPTAGSSIGSTVGSILGAVLPFQAAPNPWSSAPMPYHPQSMWN